MPRPPVATGLVASLMAVACWWRWCSRRVVVEGPSMLPTLSPGERLALVAPPLRLRPGDLVVVRDPDGSGRRLVKRVAALTKGAVEVLGDNPGASRDSRQFGLVPASSLVGRPWYRYAPSSAAGRLRRGGASR